LRQKIPLHVACEVGSVECLRILLEKQPDKQVLVQDKHQRTPLIFACKICSLDCVRELLRYEPVAQIGLDRMRQIPLHYACSEGFTEGVAELLAVAERFQISEQQRMHKDKEGCSAIHHACRASFLDCVQLLLESHADEQVLTQEADGWLPIHFATWHGVECISTLLQYRPEEQVLHRTDNDTIALHLACEIGLIEAVSPLLAHLPEQQVVAQNEQGRIPLHLACQNGFLDCAKALLEYDPESQVMHPQHPFSCPLTEEMFDFAVDLLDQGVIPEKSLDNFIIPDNELARIKKQVQLKRRSIKSARSAV